MMREEGIIAMEVVVEENNKTKIQTIKKSISSLKFNYLIIFSFSILF